MNPGDVPDLGWRRRKVLQGLAALAASGWLPPGYAQTNAQFATLSKAMTGFVYDDPALASAILKALSSAIGASTLAKIATLAASTPADRLADALRAANLDAPAAKVVVALYSGVVDTPKGPVVFTYNEALAWQAVPWTKPNALCGGQTDYWSSAPTETK